jgi:molybdate transport system substrate-binding protein
MKIFSWLVPVLSLLYSLSCSAAEYRMYSAAGVKIPMLQFASVFNEANSNSKVVNDFDTAGAAEKKFMADAKSACLITTQVRIDKAIKSGLLLGQEPIALVDTLAGLASSAKNKPSIATGADMTQALLSAKSIAFSDPARGATVGLHFQNMIKALGIEKQVMDKAILASDGVETMNLVKAKKVELGVTQVSEIIQSMPSSLVGPFPAEFELATRYSIWCKDPGDPPVLSFVSLMRSQWGASVFSGNGLRVVK